ncbi:hypothetical protein KY5_0664 [Streptomyces formicae]|uniref:Uncharacterized protein n=1 Tax=Streptomyces formicae TaxID=1616117 RepID=A0A291Q266_9ACTN|nr:hypothetical protein KY5_0664 [Streptomyces formicae]
MIRSAAEDVRSKLEELMPRSPFPETGTTQAAASLTER